MVEPTVMAQVTKRLVTRNNFVLLISDEHAIDRTVVRDFRAAEVAAEVAAEG